MADTEKKKQNKKQNNKEQELPYVFGVRTVRVSDV